MTTSQGKLYRIPAQEATANRLHAGVDLGSNTFRLLIGKVEEGCVRTVVKKMHTVRLGEALQESGCISDQALLRAQAALTDFRSHLDRHQPDAVRVCGTAALRAAANRELLLKDATAILGHPAEIIDGREEAVLSGIGALATMKESPAEPVLLADIGGGSSELMIAGATQSGPEIKTSVSLPLGAVTLSENFLQAQRPLVAELAKMAAHIKSVLAPALATMTPTPHAAIGIGGTATALAALACNLHEYDSDRIQDYRLSRASLEAIGERLNCLSGEERNRLPGLSHGRGEIIIGGLMIIKTLLEILAYQQITVSDGGLLEGILLSIANPM